MLSLKNIKNIKKIDKSNLHEAIKSFPDQISQAIEIFNKFKLTKKYYQKYQNIIICGMGSSAISGDIVKTMVQDKISIPIFINSNYFIPNWVNKNTLSIIVSHSGNTLETLKMARQTQKQKANSIIITSNGKLKKFAKKNKIPVLSFEFQPPSRTNIGFSITFIHSILKKLEILSDTPLNSGLAKLKKINKMFELNVKTDENVAKHLAYFIFDHLPVIISTPKLKGVAKHFKNQLSENSKAFAFKETVPETIHNFIESKNPWRLKDEIVFLILENIKKSTEVKATIKEFTNYLDQKNIRWQKIPIFAREYKNKILSLITLIDWTSFYLAILEKTDPASIQEIEKIKDKIYESCKKN